MSNELIMSFENSEFWVILLRGFFLMLYLFCMCVLFGKLLDKIIQYFTTPSKKKHPGCPRCGGEYIEFPEFNSAACLDPACRWNGPSSDLK